MKGTAKAGQVFRLLAVFQDGAQDKSYSSQKDPLSMGSGREKERGRYAQLVGENRQVNLFFLSLALNFFSPFSFFSLFNKLDYLRIIVIKRKIL